MEKQEILTTQKVSSFSEILTYYLNMFRDKMIAGSVDMAHYSRLKEIEPNYAMTQNGVKLTVDDLIESQRKTVMFARENAKHIEHLLELDKEGKLADIWDSIEFRA